MFSVLILDDNKPVAMQILRTIPWEEIDKIGLDAVLVRTELPLPEQKSASFWQKLRRWLDG